MLKVSVWLFHSIQVERRADHSKRNLFRRAWEGFPFFSSKVWERWNFSLPPINWIEDTCRISTRKRLSTSLHKAFYCNCCWRYLYVQLVFEAGEVRRPAQSNWQPVDRSVHPPEWHRWRRIYRHDHLVRKSPAAANGDDCRRRSTGWWSSVQREPFDDRRHL